ncbi:MAG: hypothetical protein MI725_05640 [Pirellulales bacterium]|nr:hypothetical protein [Pirellulales bacterium]
MNMFVWPKAIFNLQYGEGEYDLRPNGGNGYPDLGRCHQATVKKAFGHTKTCDVIDFLDITQQKHKGIGIKIGPTSREPE